MAAERASRPERLGKCRGGGAGAMLAALVWAALLAVDCAHAPAGGPRTGAPAPGAAARLSREVHWVRDSAEYRAAAIQVYRTATRHVEAAAAARAPGTWAVILDADETVLDNSLFQKELVTSGREFDQELWRAWVRREEAGSVPGAAAFLRRVEELGGRIAMVTNRTESECEPTRRNLRGLELPFDVVLCRPDSGDGDKDPRFERVRNGTAGTDLPPLEIVAFVGDNVGDFPGLDQGLRLQPEAALADFGTRFFVIPNPMYGSWERNPPR